MAQHITREQLTDDERRVLDLVADLFLVGHDVRPAHLAWRLEWDLARVLTTMEQLVAYGMICRKPGTLQ